MCPDRSPGCTKACLFTAGRGVFPQVMQSRIRKTQAFTSNPSFFVDSLVKDITSLCKQAARKRMVPLVRLNGTSDLPWENIQGTDVYSLPRAFPAVQFYDYTKSARRMAQFLQGHTTGAWPHNYHLTFSRSERNESDCLEILACGGNVAVVFDTKRGQPLPKDWRGYRVIDGDLDDARPSNQTSLGGGVVIGLRAKGRARKDTSGFVVKASR
jgi:hypothetical protein